MIRVRIGQFQFSNEPSYVEPIEDIESPNQEKQGITDNSGSNPKLADPNRKSHSSVFARKEKERRERQVFNDQNKRRPEGRYKPESELLKNSSRMAGIEEEEGRTNQSFLSHAHVPPQSNTQIKLMIAGGVSLFVIIFTIVIIVDSVHTINEGMVGIYFIHGALHERISHPGVHWSLPFVTDTEEVTIRPRTDTLDSINTVTKDGIQNSFVGIQVLSDVDVNVLLKLIRKFGMEFRLNMSCWLKTSLAVVVLATGFHYFVGVQVLQGYFNYFTKQKNLMSQACVQSNCMQPTFSCLANLSCLKTLACVMHCGATESEEAEAACAYICEMTYGYENNQFQKLISCMVDNSCLPTYPQDGICHSKDEDGIESLVEMKQIAGDWWVISGLNCGHLPSYPGGYDWYPCQHERFTHQDDKKQWINTVTYCGGKDSVCNTGNIITVANVSLPVPGVIKVEYLDAPLSPQEEFWRIVSWPEYGDYMLVLWCGRLPVMDYNGGIVLSRKRSGKEMPEHIRDELKKSATSFGLDFDSFCQTDNTMCPE